MLRVEKIIGYKKQVEKLKNVCDFLQNTGKYLDYGVKLPIGLLICGPSGTGKTFMAKALVDDCGREEYSISGKEMTVKTVRKLFKTARKSANSIILFDDIDYLDKDEDIDIYSQILKEISHCTNNTVFIIVTADHNKYLPEFFIDEFNSDMIIELNPPKIEEACKIFKPIFDEERVEENFDIKDFCCFAQDWTYSDLENALNHAARLAVYERCEKITMKHLIRAGLLLKDNVLTEEFDETTAYHEAGHAAVSLLLGGDAACIVLLEEGIGYFKEKNWNLETYKDRERRYIVSVAGKACEEVFTGTSSMGSFSDLDKVSQAIEADVRALASQGFEYIDSTVLDGPAYNDALAKKVQSDLQNYYDKAKQLLIENKQLIETFVEKRNITCYIVKYTRYITLILNLLFERS